MPGSPAALLGGATREYGVTPAVEMLRRSAETATFLLRIGREAHSRRVPDVPP